ncbi:MAG: sodium:solute symporter [Saprospiraceae bacterium]|jgi:Na+/proline symporter|nr:sodium:solute symporter [Saprospiraceae bacterium]
MAQPFLYLSIMLAYFAMLIAVSYFTSKDDSNENFFVAKRSSPWYLVAFGMIGASLSGVTFISIPGVVGAGKVNQCFSYMQMVWGYLIGYAIIANVLMPIYYRYQVSSIYEYLNSRLGKSAYKTGAAFFILSRTVGSAFRMYIVALVMHQFIFSHFSVPFWITVLISIFLIWVYTFRGGIKTIVITDVFQTTCMLLSLVITIYFLSRQLNVSIVDYFNTVFSSEYGKIFFWDTGWSDSNYFFKQVLGGMLIALVMTGLDQDMMQKNLTCRNLKEAQTNMFSFSMLLFVVNIAFLSLGAGLYIFMQQQGITVPAKSDQVFPFIAMNYLSSLGSILFLLGLTASNYASADSALASLTTSFCIDFLNYKNSPWDEAKKKRIRTIVHLIFSMIIFFVIVLFYILNNDAVINKVFQFAGYTYGPLLGIFCFAILTKKKISYPKLLPFICIAAPIITYILSENSQTWFGGFTFGNLIVAVNGLITFIGLLFIAKNQEVNVA